MNKKSKKMVALLGFVVPGLLLFASASFAKENGHRGSSDRTHASSFDDDDDDGAVDFDVGDLQMGGEFEQEVVGVAVSASGRVFVSFPRNGIDTVKKSVAEVINGKAVAYPNEEINTLNTAAPQTHFLSAQSVYVDSSDTLWVLDVGNLGSGTALISGGAKLVGIDLTTNAVMRTIVFPDSLITKGTSINDVRLTWRAARRALRTSRIPQRRRAAASSWWICPPATRCGGWRTIPPCCPTRLSARPWRASRLSSRRR